MYEFTHYQVRDVMTSNPVTVGEDTSLGEIEDIFDQQDFNGLPVVDELGHLLGMVTKLDLLKAFDFNEKLKIPAYESIRQYPCERIMSVNVTSVRLESPLTRVLHYMIETRHKSFPVTQDGKLKGIIAREDILTALGRAARGKLPARLYSQNQMES
jgi:CBS domain-containing protein